MPLGALSASHAHAGMVAVLVKDRIAKGAPSIHIGVGHLESRSKFRHEAGWFHAGAAVGHCVEEGPTPNRRFGQKSRTASHTGVGKLGAPTGFIQQVGQGMLFAGHGNFQGEWRGRGQLAWLRQQPRRGWLWLPPRKSWHPGRRQCAGKTPTKLRKLRHCALRWTGALSRRVPIPKMLGSIDWH